MDHIWPSFELVEIVAIRCQKSMITYVIEVTELNYEVKCDLRGRLEAAMASEATNITVICNIHMDARVVEVNEFNSEVRCDLRGYLEAAMPQKQ